MFKQLKFNIILYNKQFLSKYILISEIQIKSKQKSKKIRKTLIIIANYSYKQIKIWNTVKRNQGGNFVKKLFNITLVYSETLKFASSIKPNVIPTFFNISMLFWVGFNRSKICFITFEWFNIVYLMNLNDFKIIKITTKYAGLK